MMQSQPFYPFQLSWRYWKQGASLRIWYVQCNAKDISTKIHMYYHVLLYIYPTASAFSWILWKKVSNQITPSPPVASQINEAQSSGTSPTWPGVQRHSKSWILQASLQARPLRVWLSMSISSQWYVLCLSLMLQSLLQVVLEWVLGT